ncbi:MAG: DNA polymerase III subunit alpha [Rickettsiales bacterium]|jgi:DNA polymerase III subunit alpha|nr:DNA polymerase III subunit alpha [Rickettsiales bacterium]
MIKLAEHNLRRRRSYKTDLILKQLMQSQNFIHLRIKSSYSLGQSTLSISQIISLAQNNSLPAIVLSDRNNLFGCLEFSLHAQDYGIQPIIALCLDVLLPNKDHKHDKILLICQNETGFKNLLQLTSLYHTRADQSCITFNDIEQYSDGLICLIAAKESFIYDLLLDGVEKDAQDLIDQYVNIFNDRLYIELQRLGDKNEIAIENTLLKTALDKNIPIVATNNVSFAHKTQYQAYDILGCIVNNQYESDEKRIKPPQSVYFKSNKEMCRLFADLPEAIENTSLIAKRCSFFPTQKDPMLPHSECAEGRNETDELKEQATSGLKTHLSSPEYQEFSSTKIEEYYKRLDYELSIINKMGFPGYFLIVSDFVKWCKDNNVPVGPGRGSGAGSIVAWSLSITGLDPLRFGLLFERFLNPERVSMPDFDIDFCQEKRDRVIKYVCQKYGQEKVASIITFGKLQAKAVLKDVGRVLQMPYKRVDDICKMIPFNPVNPVTLGQAVSMDRNLRSAREQDPEIRKLIDISLQLEGLNRHVSTHAAGIVIGESDLTKVIPLYRDPRSEMPVVQYSMKYTEKAGLVKFDFLGLKTLTTIDKTLEILRAQSIDINIDTINIADKKTFELLSSGNAVGIFQLESAGMRDCLKKLRPDTIEDIIALISLYRPGPMDNIPSYIARKHNLEPVEYPHPLLEECLKETFGVIIYQEQVMQIAQILAGYSLGDADLLRRAMGKKIKAEMDAQRNIFIQGAKENKIIETQASEIFDLVAKFAGYGFNKSHAAAYAMIGYQTAYCKAHYPVEFMIATLNMDIHDTDKLNYFVQEIKRMDIKILPPSINNSSSLFKLSYREDNKVIEYALSAIKSVGLKAMEELISIRDEKGNFTDIYDFLEKTAYIINKKSLENLINSGSLDEIAPNRSLLAHNIDLLLKYAASYKNDIESNQSSLFATADNHNSLKPDLKHVPESLQSNLLDMEFTGLGFYLTSHPIESYEYLYNNTSIIKSYDVNTSFDIGEHKISLMGVVINYKQRSGKNGRFVTMTLSDSSGIFEVSIFDGDIIENARNLFVNGTRIFISASLFKDESGYRISVKQIILLEQYVHNLQIDLQILLDQSFELDHFTKFLSKKSSVSANLSFEIMYKDHKIKLSCVKKHPVLLKDIDKNVKNIHVRVDRG